MLFTKTKKRFISAVLTIAMVVGIIMVIPVFANEENTPLLNNFNITEETELSEEDMPEVIDDIISDYNHIERLYDEEEMDTVIFANDDNTKTVYFFDEPIKYIDEDGEIQDKSSILYDDFDIEEYPEFKEEYAYVNLDNDIRTFFPEEISIDSGVMLTYEDYNIELSPIAENSASVMPHPDDENSVIYEQVFGDNTAIQYTTFFSGFKDDIIL